MNHSHKTWFHENPILFTNIELLAILNLVIHDIRPPKDITLSYREQSIQISKKIQSHFISLGLFTLDDLQTLFHKTIKLPG